MERNYKSLQELTILDGFMFGAVMTDKSICQELLERILGFPIGHLDIIPEKNLSYHPEYKGIRLDIYAKDENNTHYDVEMQVRSTPVEKRSRYYHSQMDMELLMSGMSYDKLPESYVIFIMNYDPFHQGKYRYSIHSQCTECPEMQIRDGVHTIILNNHGQNAGEVPDELVRFLQFTSKSLTESEYPSEDIFITRIQNRIRQIKGSREMGERYMHLQELLREEREEARKEGRLEGKSEGQEIAIINIVKKGLITLEQGATELGITVEQLREKMTEIISDNPK